jgi:rRNA-processing protein FCF1
MLGAINVLFFFFPMAESDWVFLVLDTNVLMSSLDTLESLMAHINPINMQIYVPEVVVRELDNLKKRSPEANRASLFLEYHAARANPKVVIEPVSEYTPAAGKSDDIILGECKKIKHPFLLSNDINLRLKAISSGVKCICPGERSAGSIFKEVISKVKHIDFMEYHLPEDNVIAETVEKNRIAKAIYYSKVRPVFVKEVGEEMIKHFIKNEQSITLETLLRTVLKNYSIFHSLLPKNGKNVLRKTLQSLRDNKSDFEENMESILFIFGMSSLEV